MLKCVREKKRKKEKTAVDEVANNNNNKNSPLFSPPSLTPVAVLGVALLLRSAVDGHCGDVAAPLARGDEREPRVHRVAAVFHAEETLALASSSAEELLPLPPPPPVLLSVPRGPKSPVLSLDEAS